MTSTTLRNAAHALVTFTPRRIGVAILASIVVFLLLGLSTALIPNPVFGRSIDAPEWSVTALAVTALLSGITLATYVATPLPPDTETGTRRFTIGGVLAFFAIGCPTCNKLVLIALGSSGAITWFAPVQPYLATAGIVLLVWVAITRLANDTSCRVPQNQ